MPGCSTGDAVSDGAAAETVAPATSEPAPRPTSTLPAPPATVAPDDPGGAHIRVTQDLTACCYPAGHLSWLLVVDADGEAFVRRLVRPLADPYPMVDLMLPQGAYHVVSAQQACSATCATVGDAVDRCDADVDLAAGSTTFLTVGVAPGAGCVIVRSPAPVTAPIADEVALPGTEVDCGYDASLVEADASGRNVVLSDARRCLAAAAARGVSAWLEADEPADGGSGVASMVVYRVEAGGVLTVYRLVEPGGPAGAWIRTRCARVVPADVRAFLAQGCAEAEAVPWASVD